jgi:general stress protein 26
MSFATVRPDGYPQATTVVYVNDGFTLYFACDSGSQKVRNLARSRKASLTIGHDYADWSRIRGLSMGGDAGVVKDETERERAFRWMAKKFPAMRGLSPQEKAGMVIVRVRPRVISVIDYQRGFGHTDQVRV